MDDKDKLIKKLRKKIKRLKREKPHPCPVCKVRDCTFCETRMEWKFPFANATMNYEHDEHVQYRVSGQIQYIGNKNVGTNYHYRLGTQTQTILQTLRSARIQLIADETEKVCIIIEQQDDDEVVVQIERTFKRKREDGSDSGSE